MRTPSHEQEESRRAARLHDARARERARLIELSCLSRDTAGARRHHEHHAARLADPPEHTIPNALAVVTDDGTAASPDGARIRHLRLMSVRVCRVCSVGATKSAPISIQCAGSPASDRGIGVSARIACARGEVRVENGEPGTAAQSARRPSGGEAARWARRKSTPGGFANPARIARVLARYAQAFTYWFPSCSTRCAAVDWCRRPGSSRCRTSGVNGDPEAHRRSPNC